MPSEDCSLFCPECDRQAVVLARRGRATHVAFALVLAGMVVAGIAVTGLYYLTPWFVCVLGLPIWAIATSSKTVWRCDYCGRRNLVSGTRSPLILLIFIAMPILLFTFPIALWDTVPDRFRTTIADPASDFTRYTGLAWPESARIVSVDDDHGGFRGKGVFHIIFDVDRETLERWLVDSPPWGGRSWKRGPVPWEIGGSFGEAHSVSATSIDGGPYKYHGDPMVVQMLGSDKTWYAAKERCCEGMPWRRGVALILDLGNNRVWVSSWDY